MPTKPNKAGEQQPYIPAGNGDSSGEYADNGGTNVHFQSFKKPEESVKSSSKTKITNSVKKETIKESPKVKSLNDYTDELLKKSGVKEYTSKKYKNKDNDIVEIRRFGEGKHAIRFNQTKNIVEQVWYNGEKIN